MCNLDTAFEIVVLGLLSLVKNVRLFKAALEGPGTVGSFLNVIYYAAATVMALWLILSVLTGNKPSLLNYVSAAKVQATVCFYWQFIIFVVDAFQSAERTENVSINFSISMSGVSFKMRRKSGIYIPEAILGILVPCLIAYVCLLGVDYIRRFIIGRIEAYAATLPN
ncbi:hypothetical protein MTO96_012192 [Rhipicephalus appendiculatus]